MILISIEIRMPSNETVMHKINDLVRRAAQVMLPENKKQQVVTITASNSSK